MNDNLLLLAVLAFMLFLLAWAAHCRLKEESTMGTHIYEKAPWVVHYIARPVARFFRWIAKRAMRLFDKLVPRWYCDGCDKWHTSRVVAYYRIEWGEDEAVCFEHVNPRLVFRYGQIIQGNRHVAGKVRQAVYEQFGLTETECRAAVQEAAAVLSAYCDGIYNGEGCGDCPMHGQCTSELDLWMAPAALPPEVYKAVELLAANCAAGPCNGCPVDYFCRDFKLGGNSHD